MNKNKKIPVANFYFTYPSPVGELFIAEDDEGICCISFYELDILNIPKKETSLIKRTAKQLQEYFAGKRKQFDIPLSTHGTDFQQKVWHTLQQIPYGETQCYEQIAKSAGNPKACRAVGSANNKNPISILIPCHRVIGKNGKLVGYGGGLDIKEFLLNLEAQGE
ncbi:MAG: methylated-DNA--[protein]-cysteine S-methyltransferase [Peptostreptococcaceae bacterium]|nr:methylated-DNA--[protein]-cysteine S-methyltransferase [Peptostreptococcaceae bacterium]